MNNIVAKIFNNLRYLYKIDLKTINYNKYIAYKLLKIIQSCQLNIPGLKYNIIINEYLKELKEFIDNENLNDNERKLGYALIDLFDNYQTIFSGADNNKFNKNVILLSLREMTNLSTKEIRSSIKRFKKLYIVIQTRMKN